jgi:peroxiredoxin
MPPPAANALLVSLLTCAVALGGQPEPGKGKAAPPKAADPAAARVVPPPLAVSAWLNGGPLSLAELKGKVVVLHFWGVVNGPSRKLLPRLRDLYEKHKAEGLVVLGVTEDQKPEVEMFAQLHRLTYPIALDDKGTTHGAYRVEFLPTVCLIDRQGFLTWQAYVEDFTDEPVLSLLRQKEGR